MDYVCLVLNCPMDNMSTTIRYITHPAADGRFSQPTIKRVHAAMEQPHNGIKFLLGTATGYFVVIVVLFWRS